jgi:hypothetical protein
MYGRPGGIGGVGAGAGGLSATGFAFGVWVAVGIAAIVCGLLLLRLAMFRWHEREERPPC